RHGPPPRALPSFELAMSFVHVGRRSTTGVCLWLQLANRPDLDRALAGRRNLRRDLNGLVQIRCLDQIEPRELLFGLGERAIGHEQLTITDSDRGCGLDGLQRLGCDEKPALAESVATGGAFAVVNRVKLLSFEIDETDVFHGVHT